MSSEKISLILKIKQKRNKQRNKQTETLNNFATQDASKWFKVSFKYIHRLNLW